MERVTSRTKSDYKTEHPRVGQVVWSIRANDFKQQFVNTQREGFSKDGLSHHNEVVV
jgi:hypothetical protein